MKRGGGALLLPLDFATAEGELRGARAGSGRRGRRGAVPPRMGAPPVCRSGGSPAQRVRGARQGRAVRDLRSVRPRTRGQRRAPQLRRARRAPRDRRDPGDEPPRRGAARASARPCSRRSLPSPAAKPSTGPKRAPSSGSRCREVTLPQAPLSDAAVARLRQVADLPDVGATRYEILGTLGRGGMATVYLAHDRELDREVALKVVDTVDSSAAARSAHAARSTYHRGARAPGHRAGARRRHAPGRPGVLRDATGQRPAPRPARAAPHPSPSACASSCASARPVAFCHAHGVLHLDLKPQNVMTGALRRGAGHGLGPGASGAIAPAEARSGAFGTPGFMAPEQAQRSDGRAVIDERADVYALGGILAHLARGRRGAEAAAGDRRARPRPTGPRSATLRQRRCFATVAVPRRRGGLGLPRKPAERALRWSWRGIVSRSGSSPRT